MGDAAEIEVGTGDVVITIKVAEVMIKDTEGATAVIEEDAEVIAMTVEFTEEIEAMVVTAMIGEATATIGDIVVTVMTVEVIVKTIKVAMAEEEVVTVTIGIEIEVFREVAGRNNELRVTTCQLICSSKTFFIREMQKIGSFSR